MTASLCQHGVFRSTWTAMTTALVIACSYALDLGIHVVPAITTTVNETTTEPDAIRRLNKSDTHGL